MNLLRYSNYYKKTLLNKSKYLQQHSFVDLSQILQISPLSFTAVTILGSSAIFAYDRYKISTPDEYLVRTGLGIKGMNISKSEMQWPFQEAFKVSIVPKTHII